MQCYNFTSTTTPTVCDGVIGKVDNLIGTDMANTAIGWITELITGYWYVIFGILFVLAMRRMFFKLARF